MNTMNCPHRLVNVRFQQFNSQSFMNVPLSIAPAHFYVHCGLFLECPPEPWSKRVVTATASRVAVLSIPEGVVGVLSGQVWEVCSEWQIHSKGPVPQLAVSWLLGRLHRDSYSHMIHFPGSLRHMSKYGCVHPEAHM